MKGLTFKGGAGVRAAAAPLGILNDGVGAVHLWGNLNIPNSTLLTGVRNLNLGRNCAANVIVVLAQVWQRSFAHGSFAHACTAC